MPKKTTLNHIAASIFICFFTCIRCHAQLVTSSLSEIEQFGVQYAYQPQTVFAISDNFENKLTTSLNYTGFTGIRKNVRTIRAAGDLHFSSDSKKLSSSLGINMSNNYAGPFITKSRIFAHYQSTIPLTSNINCFAGAHIGFFNSAIKDNPSGVFGSAIAPDGNFSIGIKTKSFNIGTHVHQIFNNNLNSNIIDIELKRYYSVRANYNTLINKNINIITGIWYRIISFQKNDCYFDATLMTEKIGFGIIYATQNQVSATCLLKNMGRTNSWGINFTSHIDLKTTVLSRLGTFEIGLNYNLSNGSLLL